MKTRLYKEVTYKEIQYAEVDVPEGIWDKTVKAADPIDWIVLYPQKISWQGIVKRQNIEEPWYVSPFYEEPHA